MKRFDSLFDVNKHVRLMKFIGLSHQMLSAKTQPPENILFVVMLFLTSVNHILNTNLMLQQNQKGISL